MNTIEAEDRLAPQWVGIAVMALLVVAALAIGSPPRRGAEPAANADDAWQHAIEAGADHIEPVELAEALMAGTERLLLVDVRPAPEFAAFHLPTAVNLGVPELLGERGAALMAAADQVVLYSNGPAHPGQAWVELARRGYRNVRVLAGGLADFERDVLTPPSLRPFATETTSRRDGARWPLVRAFFLGGRSIEPRGAWATDPPSLAAPTMVSAAWLERHRDDVAVLDVRPREQFAALHVPGARWLDGDALRRPAGDRRLHLVADDELCRQFGELGVDRDTPVVLVAQDRMHDATLAALALLHLGHERLALLDGGMLAWAHARLPLVAGVADVAARRYEPRPEADDFTIGTDELARAVRDGSTRVLDVRPAEAFRGDVVTEARGGHIPGAVNRCYQQDLLTTADGQWLRTREQLARDYAALGFSSETPIAVSCRTGHTASLSYFVLRFLLGHRHVRWHSGSWTEWAQRPELPAATGDE